MHSFFALGHVAAAWGAKALMVETTNTTGPKMDKEYRHNVSPFSWRFDMSCHVDADYNMFV